MIMVPESAPVDIDSGVHYKIAGNYLTQADAVTASRYLQAKGYPNTMIDIIDPGYPLQVQMHHQEHHGSDSDAGKRPLLQAMMVIGVFVAASALIGQVEGTIWGSTSLTLGIMGLTTILGAAAMLFHGKPFKELQFERIIHRYASKKYWTVLVYADHEKLARFALRLIERTSCRNALVCGPVPIR